MTQTVKPPRGNDEITVSDLPNLVGSGVLKALLPIAVERPVLGTYLYDRLDRGAIAGQIALFCGVGTSRFVDVAAAMVDVAHRGAVGAVLDPLPVREDVEHMLELALQLELPVLERQTGATWLELVDSLRQVLKGDDADVVASGVAVGDLTALAESSAAMLGGPVIIEDAKYRVLAYSSSTSHVDRGRDAAILGRRIPDEWLKHLESIGATETLLNTDAVISVEGGPFRAKRRLLSSIRADGFMLGVLWVAEGKEPLAENIAERVAVAARAASPHLLRHQEESVGQRVAQQKTLGTLLETGLVPRSAAEELDISPARGYAVLALRCQDDDTLTSLDRHRLVELTALYCQSFRWRSATTSIGHSVYSLIALGPEHLLDRIPSLAALIVENASRALSGRSIRAAISGETSGLRDVPSLRLQVDRVLDIPMANHVVRFDEVFPQIVLSDVQRFLADEGTKFAKLERLRAFDRDNNSDYVETLRVFLQNFGNSQDAAAKLGVHVTTLRYRLKKMENVSSIALSDPAERLLLEVLLGTLAT